VTTNINISFTSNSNIPNFPIKSLQEYRNRLHGINSERSESKIGNNLLFHNNVRNLKINSFF
jgi:hypothetical protein